LIPLLTTERAALVQGDAVGFLRTLPDRSVDHVITDPPYSPKVHTAHRIGCTGVAEPTRPNAKRAQFNRVKELGFEPLTPELRHTLAREFARVARRWVLVFCDHEGSGAWKDELELAGLEYVRTLIWIKKGCTPQFTGDRPANGHECIVLAHQRKPDGKNIKKRWNGGGKHGVYTFPIVLNRSGKTPRLHTAQKPIELMEQLVLDFTDENEVIVDPMAGSGTTLLAAQKHGRCWLGVEQSPEYAEIAKARLEHALKAVNDNE
jgi:DNA modification methylase